MKRNQGGERDLDRHHPRGARVDRACLSTACARLIFCLATSSAGPGGSSSEGGQVPEPWCRRHRSRRTRIAHAGARRRGHRLPRSVRRGPRAASLGTTGAHGRARRYTAAPAWPCSRARPRASATALPQAARGAPPNWSNRGRCSSLSQLEPAHARVTGLAELGRRCARSERGRSLRHQHRRPYLHAPAPRISAAHRVRHPDRRAGTASRSSGAASRVRVLTSRP
jgi:hypothetical protein